MSTRIEWVDIAKGIGIILVVIGHMVKGNGIVGQSIWAFHMPLFFFLSGMFMRPTELFISLIAKKARQLLLPCLSFSIIIAAVHYFLMGDNNAFENLTKHLPDTCWFLTTLFLTSLWSALLLRLVNQWIAIMICLILALICQILSIPTDFSLSSTFVASVFYISGYSFVESKAQMGGGIYIVFILFPVVVYSFNVHTALNENDFSLVGLVSAYLGILQVIIISQTLSKIKGDKLRRGLVFMGRNSLVVMLTHMLFISIYCYFVHIDNTLVFKSLQFAFVFTMSILSVYIFKSRLKVLLGKF